MPKNREEVSEWELDGFHVLENSERLSASIWPGRSSISTEVERKYVQPYPILMMTNILLEHRSVCVLSVYLIFEVAPFSEAGFTDQEDVHLFWTQERQVPCCVEAVSWRSVDDG